MTKYFSFSLMLSALVLGAVHATPSRSFNARPTSGKRSYTLYNCAKDHLHQFPDLAAINELNVHNCLIPSLENAFFVRFTSLNALQITDSQLAVLDDYALHGLKQLRTLSLACNNISEVRSWSHEPMSALTSLDLRRNAIHTLTLKSFFRYPNLQRLNLAANFLDDIEDGVFRWMPHLKYLNLGRNRLHVVDARHFHGMHRLSHLALHFNEIVDIEPESFETNSHLRSLRLEGNRLRNVQFLAAKNLMRLAHLNLSHNAIESLASLAFSKDYELTDLDISHNHLTIVQADAFVDLESLERLNVSHNFIERIEASAFQQLGSLEYLELAHNNLSQLPADVFNGTALLQSINLSHNMLHDINATLFADMPYLRVLDLSGNQLYSEEFIEALATQLNRGELTLNLSDNHFRGLNLSSLMDFERVELAGNWWSCQWLIREMLRIPKTIHFGRSYGVVTAWSADLLSVNGIDCYDEQSKRSIIVLDAGHVWERKLQTVECSHSSSELDPSAPPLVWPKIKSDRFDSRSVVLWMLIAIAIAFSALRVARKLLDQKEHKQRLQLLRQKYKARQGCKDLTKPRKSNDAASNSDDGLGKAPLRPASHE